MELEWRQLTYGTIASVLAVGLIWVIGNSIGLFRAQPIWSLVALFLFVVVVQQVWFLRRERTFQVAVDRMTEPFSAFKLGLPNLIEHYGSRDDACKMCRHIISECQRMLDNVVARASVMVPEGEYLVVYASVDMSLPDEYERKFYIGPDTNVNRGLAGHAYVTGKVDIARNRKRGPSYGNDFDHPSFKEIGDPSRPLPYKAVIAIPVFNPFSTSNEIIGVFCLDSANSKAFSDDKLVTSLEEIGSLLGLTVVISRALQNSHENEGIDPNAHWL